MEFRILGPLEVSAGGQEVPLGGARQRSVLAILLIHRGHVVSGDRIVDELWGERPPETASKTVQVYVSRLRKALGEGVLVTRGGGYTLELREAEIDADRFAQLAADGQEALDEGEHRQAAEHLAAALKLWRGPPLADFAYEDFAQQEIARLEEQRLSALESRIEADLALGRHSQLVNELEALVAEHPERERLLAQLMLALYRSGRQSDALAGYRNAQRALIERGLEAGPELRELERAILAQDPAIAAPPRASPAAVLREHRLGGALAAFGGGLLLAVVIAAVIASGGGEGQELAGPNSLAVIDPASNELDSTVPTGVQPADVSADGDNIWVANRADDNVTQVDLGTKAVVGTVAAGIDVAGIAAGGGGPGSATPRDPAWSGSTPPSGPSKARSGCRRRRRSTLWARIR